MIISNRRVFFIQAGAATGAALLASLARAQVPSKLAENDPQAVALGYKLDTTKVDAKKYPKHVAAQRCDNCQLFLGKATDAEGGCSIFPGKQVVASGWCSVWAKRPA
jgi:hypothetical protein